jgi:hypothetical protein
MTPPRKSREQVRQEIESLFQSPTVIKPHPMATARSAAESTMNFSQPSTTAMSPYSTSNVVVPRVGAPPESPPPPPYESLGVASGSGTRSPLNPRASAYIPSPGAAFAVQAESASTRAGRAIEPFPWSPRRLPVPPAKKPMDHNDDFDNFF